MFSNKQRVDSKEEGVVMVVDDNDDHRQSTTILIESMGYHTISAKNGIEACSVYEKHAPNLVIMDINMPKMSGYEAFFKIKKSHPNAKIILMTSYQDYSKLAEAKRNCMIYLLQKPFTDTLLEELIKANIKNAPFVCENQQ